MDDKNIKNSISKLHLEFGQPPYMMKTEQKAESIYFACGCREGALFIFIVLIPIVTYSLIFDFNFPELWEIILLVLAASLLGKITGLIFSRYNSIKSIMNWKKN